MEEQRLPERRWFYLGGEFRDTSGARTTDPGDADFPPSAWFEYGPEVAFQLSESYQALLDAGNVGNAKMLDLSMFSNPPLPYEIWHGCRVKVCNPNAPARLRGKFVVGGFCADFWDKIEDRVKMLPEDTAKWVDMGIAKVRGCFYQIHHEHLGNLEQMLKFLQDDSGWESAPTAEPRKRLVMQIEFPVGWSQRTGRKSDITPGGEDTTPLDEGDPPVYEWWYGDRPPQAECTGSPPRGFWRRYHPTVCRRLEHAFQKIAHFQDCSSAVDIDGVRYMIQRITAEKPFNIGPGTGLAAVEFQESSVITVDYPVFEDLDRLQHNCLIQFRKANANRRRPARRRINAEEIARNATRTGEACCICFSEVGEVLGCEQVHVICGYCLRAGLRSMAGDITVLDGLLCGCFSYKSRGTMSVLSQRSDRALQEALKTPATNHMDAMLLADELKATRRQFDMETEDPIPPTLYTSKISSWYDKVVRQQVMPNYYVCSHPDCADLIENWMSRDIFDTDYRANGKFEWHCPLGHLNAVLPMKDEIDEINKTLLLHPEYYTSSASYDHCPLRRYRLCRGCVTTGVLLLAVHADGCKQWPGGGSAHRHCFCFSCSRPWSDCGHGVSCSDPGIQQVRLRDAVLEIGHVDGKEYLSWLQGSRSEPPPTIFESGPQVSGIERQRSLQMSDRQALLAESQQGTA